MVSLMESFHHPNFLWLLVLVPLIGWRLWNAHWQQAVHFSSLDASANWHPTLRQRLGWIPSALLLVALTLLIVALARPREGREQTTVESEGIAIEMVVDRSGSMQAMDFKINGQNVDRLTAIKNVAGTFVEGNHDSSGSSAELSGRISDLIGLISFAGFADALTPPTLDHSFLLGQLNRVQIVDQRNEDGTAIGDAISLAIEKLNALDERRDEKVKSKIVILLTDGENNAGQFDPVQAAELAKAMGVRVYTIGVGTRGRAPFPVDDVFGRRSIQWMDVDIDEDTLREIASVTGGKYYRATDTESLLSIYEEIDALEKTEVESRHFVDYRELAIRSGQFGKWATPPPVLLALLALALRLALTHTVFRQLP